MESDECAAMVLRHTARRDGKLLGFLRGELGLSEHLVRRLKYRNAYRVNGVAVHTSHPVRAGNVITVTIDEDPPDFEPQYGPLSILHEDAAIVALDKPAGMIVHPTFNRNDGTLANYILGHYQRTGQRSAVHFVNRLDRDTFGVVLVAKNAHIHALLCDRMQAGAIEKTYEAAVYGHPPGPEGTICHPIARLSATSLLRCVRADGKPAATRYAVLRATASCSLLRLWPLTGRTHQLRVHCAHEGFPILGDAQYGTEASQAYSALCGYEYQQLCAASLRFAHPLTGRAMDIRSRLSVRLPEA